MRLWLLGGAALIGACSSKVDWNRKDAFRHCGAAIAAYPGKAAPPCAALAMCANEAELTAAERAKLDRMIADSRCPKP